MADCPTDNDISNANKLPGFGGNEIQSRPLTEEMREAQNVNAERAERNAIEEQLSSAPATAQVLTGESITTGIKKLARAIGNRALQFFNPAKEAQNRVWEAAELAAKIVNGTTKLDATFWMNFQNFVDKVFVNERADILYFGDLFLHEPGKPKSQNSWIQAFNQMRPKIRGLHAIYKERAQDILDNCIRLARGTIYSGTEIANFAGEYLNCLHAPERNAHLLRHWNEIIKENAKRIDTLIFNNDTLSRKERAELKSLESVNRQLIKQVEQLTKYLESDNPPAGLIHGGYTNKQARDKLAYIEKQTGLSKAELEGVARQISDTFDYLTKELAEAGAIPPEQLAAIPDFKWYAPQLSQGMNLIAASNDATHYVPGSRHQANGMTEPPDNAWLTLDYAMRRTATEIGSQDFGLLLAAAERKFNKKKDGEPDWTSPIRSFNEKQLMAMLSSGTIEQRQEANAMLNNNGMVVNVPVTAKDGTRSFERRYYWFNPRWSSGRLTGEALNLALSSNYKLGTKPVEMLATATSYYGQSHTRFLPGFAPVAGIRDFTERLLHIASREFIDENGQRISGTSIVGQYAANIARVGSGLFQAMRGKIDPNSEIGRLYNEYRRQGLLQKFTPAVKQEPKPIEQIAEGNSIADSLRDWKLDKQADWLQERRFDAWRKVINQAGDAGNKAIRVIDSWNDYWQNIPSFAQYVTLRKAGLSAKDAAAHTLDVMNMSQVGSVTKMLAVIAPFVRPTMQGAKAFATSMGLTGRNAEEIIANGKRGWMTGLAASIAFGGLLSLIRDSMGTDEKGRPVMDSIPISRMTTSIQIGLDDEGNVIKLPVGFGPVRVAYALAACMDRISRGIMNPSDAAFEVLFAAARDSVPGNNPMFNFKDKPAEFIMQYLCPAPLKPFLELSQNTNAFGGKIYKDDGSFDKAAAEQGFKTTPAVWHRVARDMLREYGFDIAPEAYAHVAKGLTYGPGRMITSGIVSFAESDEPYLGMNKPTALRDMNPILAMLGGTLFYGKARDPSKTYYYQAADDLMLKAKRAGVDMTQDGKTGEEGREIVRRKLLDAGLDNDTVEDIMRLRASRAKLISQGSAFTKKHPHWYDEPDAESLKTDFEDLFNQNEAVYKEFYKTANYFNK